MLEVVPHPIQDLRFLCPHALRVFFTATHSTGSTLGNRRIRTNGWSTIGRVTSDSHAAPPTGPWYFDSPPPPGGGSGIGISMSRVPRRRRARLRREIPPPRFLGMACPSSTSCTARNATGSTLGSRHTRTNGVNTTWPVTSDSPGAPPTGSWYFGSPPPPGGGALVIEQRTKRSQSRKSIFRWIHGPGNQILPSVWKDLAWKSRHSPFRFSQRDPPNRFRTRQRAPRPLVLAA